MKNYITAIIIATGFIIAALIFSNTYKYKFHSVEEVSVVGLAEVDFTSDLIVWQGSFVRRSFNLKEAYASLKNDELAIRDYLKQKGIPDSSMISTAVNIEKEFNQSYDLKGNVVNNFAGFKLTQSVKIQSLDINRVETISREVTELIEKGIEFNSTEPLYFYTKLASLKMDLLAKASADAKLRAETIAKSVNSQLGKLKKANMGVFQITGKNSNEDFSYGGSFNTRDKFKTATITIRMDYGLR
jgi:uncharacterized protein